MTSTRIGANPSLHMIEIISAMKGDLLACHLILHVASVFPKMTMESHICTPADGQQGFVHVGNLKYYALGRRTSQSHHVASSLPLIGNGLAIRDLILSSMRTR